MWNQLQKEVVNRGEARHKKAAWGEQPELALAQYNQSTEHRIFQGAHAGQGGGRALRLCRTPFASSQL